MRNLIEIFPSFYTQVAYALRALFGKNKKKRPFVATKATKGLYTQVNSKIVFFLLEVHSP